MHAVSSEHLKAAHMNKSMTVYKAPLFWSPGSWLLAVSWSGSIETKISAYNRLSGDTSLFFHRFHRGSSNFDQIRMDCLRRGQMFEDPDFPASDASVYYSCNPPLRLEWKRPAVGSFSLHLQPYLNINLGRKV